MKTTVKFMSIFFLVALCFHPYSAKAEIKFDPIVTSKMKEYTTFIIDNNDKKVEQKTLESYKNALINSLSRLNTSHDIDEEKDIKNFTKLVKDHDGRIETMKPIWESLVSLVVDEQKK